MPISGPNNLCDVHRIPGAAIRIGKSTMVITAWYAERGDEVGIIVLNDYALGDHFGGRAAFEARLAEQGFVNVRNLATLEQVEAAKHLPPGRKAGRWSGPWRTAYAWEIQ